jgi:hypothetical protein
MQIQKRGERYVTFGFQVFEAINDCLFVSAPVANKIGSFDFQHTQMCTEAAKPIVEHEGNEAKRKEAKRAQEYTLKCSGEIHEVL